LNVQFKNNKIEGTNTPNSLVSLNCDVKNKLLKDNNQIQNNIIKLMNDKGEYICNNLIASK